MYLKRLTLVLACLLLLSTTASAFEIPFLTPKEKTSDDMKVDTNATLNRTINLSNTLLSKYDVSEPIGSVAIVIEPNTYYIESTGNNFEMLTDKPQTIEYRVWTDVKTLEETNSILENIKQNNKVSIFDKAKLMYIYQKTAIKGIDEPLTMAGIIK